MSIKLHIDGAYPAESEVAFETEDVYVRAVEIATDLTKYDSPTRDGYEIVLRADDVVQGQSISLTTAIQAAFGAQQTLDEVRAFVDREAQAKSQQQSRGLASVLDLPLDGDNEPEVH